MSSGSKKKLAKNGEVFGYLWTIVGTMIDKTYFKKNLGRVLVAAGFKNKGQSWYLDGTDSIVVLNLQKSDYDDKYYFNFGVWLKALGAAEFPKENHCHISARVDGIFREEVELFERGGRINTDEHEAFDQLLEFFQKKVIPFCLECLPTVALAKKLEEGQFNSSLVTKIARDLLLGKSPAI
jgi:hypothetical protein